MDNTTPTYNPNKGAYSVDQTAKYPQQPRNTGELGMELQSGYDLVTRLFEELQMLVDALEPVSKKPDMPVGGNVCPSGVSGSPYSTRLAENNNRIASAVSELVGIRERLVI